MDIIDKLLEMKKIHDYAKHDEIAICFFAPLDFLQYLRKQEKIIYKLINASSIEYLENEKELDKYYVENIINITIGIKAESKKTGMTDKKERIREILSIKEQELQTIRSLVSGLSASSADPDLIREKKKEMSNLKKKIEELEYELQKEKFNK